MKSLNKCLFASLFAFLALSAHALEIKRVMTAEKDGNSVNPDTTFLIQFTDEVNSQELEKLIHFKVDGKASNVSARVVAMPSLKNSSAQHYLDLKKTYAVKPVENFPYNRTFQMVIGAGLSTADGSSKTEQAMTRSFAVNSTPWGVSISCSKTLEGKCNPLYDVTAKIDNSVSAEEADSIVLESPSKTLIKGKREGSYITFHGPFAENQEYRVRVPKKETAKKDDASSLYLSLEMDSYPPLAKFSGPFGILESTEKPLLPLTLRHLTKKNEVKTEISGLKAKIDTRDMRSFIEWMKRVDTFAQRQELTYRKYSIFGEDKSTNAKPFTIPHHSKKFEVVGVELNEGPGFYVVEVKSNILAKHYMALKDNDSTMMWAHSSALVTNMVVHFKLGRDSSLAWVTSLDKGLPVDGAQVGLYDCEGKQVAQGTTGSDGLVKFKEDLTGKFNETCGNVKTRRGDDDEDKEAFGSRSIYQHGLFISARKGNDFTFSHSSMDQGIEPWRFGSKINRRSPHEVKKTFFKKLNLHTLFDRPIYRRGETIHMIHFARQGRDNGTFSQPNLKDLPKIISLSNEAAGRKVRLELKWDANQGRAVTDWQVPEGMELGNYDINYVFPVKNEETEEDETLIPSGSLYIDKFIKPMFMGHLNLPGETLVQPDSVTVDMFVANLNGGTAQNLPIQLSWHTSDLEYKNDEGLPVNLGPVRPGPVAEERPANQVHLTFNKQTSTDKNGSATTTLNQIAKFEKPVRLTVEGAYQDPTGRINTVSASKTVFPANRLMAIAAPNQTFMRTISFSIFVDDANGKGIPAPQVEVEILAEKVFSHRQLQAGGYYGEKNFQVLEKEKADVTCRSQVERPGILLCKATVADSGVKKIVAKTKDEKGRVVYTNAEVKVEDRESDAWGRISAADRVDLIPLKKEYQPGEKAAFLFETPYETASVLLTVEREGIITQKVVTVKRNNPYIELDITKDMAPNAFISATAVRGRLEGDHTITYFTDLGRPSFKVGLTEINVGSLGQKLNVAVVPNKTTYSAGDLVTVDVKINSAIENNIPAGTDFAVAVVDSGLLEMAENKSWNILDAIMGKRELEVEMYSAQTQVVGKRHFGLKAIASGGGGGRLVTREFFETLIHWNPNVKVNSKGVARVQFKTPSEYSGQYTVVVVATGGAQYFGTGRANFSSEKRVTLQPSIGASSVTNSKFPQDITLKNSSPTQQKLTVKSTVSFTGDEKILRLTEQKALMVNAHEAKNLQLKSINVPQGTREIVYDYQVLDKSKKVIEHKVVKQKINSKEADYSLLSHLAKDATFNPKAALIERAAQLNFDFKMVRLGLERLNADDNTVRLTKALVYRSPKVLRNMTSELLMSRDNLSGFMKWHPRMYFGDPMLTATVAMIAGLEDWGQNDALSAYYSEILKHAKNAGNEPYHDANNLNTSVLIASILSSGLVQDLKAEQKLEMLAEADLREVIEGKAEESPEDLHTLDLIARILILEKAAEMAAKTEENMLKLIKDGGEPPRYASAQVMKGTLKNYVTALAARLQKSGGELRLAMTLGEEPKAKKQQGWYEKGMAAVKNAYNKVAGNKDNEDDQEDSAEESEYNNPDFTNAFFLAAITKSSTLQKTFGGYTADLAATQLNSLQNGMWSSLPATTLSVAALRSAGRSLKAEDVWTLATKRAKPLTVKAPYKVSKQIVPISVKDKTGKSVGDIYRVTISVSAGDSSDLIFNKVTITDPVPGSADVTNFSYLNEDNFEGRRSRSRVGYTTRYYQRQVGSSVERDRVAVSFNLLPGKTVGFSYDIRLKSKGEYQVSETIVENLSRLALSSKMSNEAWNVKE